MSFAASTVTKSVIHITSATVTVISSPIIALSTIIIFTKFIKASAKPHKNATLISFHTTFIRSLNSTSPRDKPLITVTED